MAWAIFHKESNWARPNSRFSFNAHASPTPQERPHDFVDYCVEQGLAERYPSPSKTEADAIRPRRKRK